MSTVDVDSLAEGRILPERYTIRTTEEESLIKCRETPNIVVSIRRDLSISASSASKYDPGTIFLDGAVDGPPFIDGERHIYNLDHHKGVVRLFTLSACEQAYVLIRSRLDLREREWKILANEPDLDTVLAIWLLLNHSRVSDPDEELRRELIPLVRLEGVIDVHGLDLLELTCLQDEELEKNRLRLAGLMEEEARLKKEGLWSETDPLEYTVKLLDRIDHLVYSPWQFEGFNVVDELEKVTLDGNQVAVIVRAENGIYETERQLLHLYEKRLGIVGLLKEGSRYTLRMVKPFLTRNLHPVYTLLNLMDPAVKSGNRWGGSDTIGGSPRKSGTGLSPQDVAWAIEKAFARPAVLEVLVRIASTLVVVAAALFCGWTLNLLVGNTSLLFVVGFSIFSVVSLIIFARPYPRLYGLKSPVGKSWWLFLGLAVIGGLLGGTWYPMHFGTAGASWPGALISAAPVLAASASAELLFRGVVHGLLAEVFPVTGSAEKGMLSWPVILSALMYGAAGIAPFIPGTGVAGLQSFPLPMEDLSLKIVVFAGGLLFGLAAGIAREESESILPAVLFHWVTIGFLVFVSERVFRLAS